MKIDIGIDPDSSKHGAAIAINGTLTHLKSMTLLELYQFLIDHKQAEINFHVEDVLKINATFKKRGIRNLRAKGRVTRNVGMMQQAWREQLKAIESLKDHNITITYFPISKNWKDAEYGKEQLIKYFNYHGRSNEDTRSAAYFLYRGIYHNY